jgi:hypothetical protein
MFTAAGEGGYVAEKAEGRTGWLFPVGDEVHELGYVHMFQDMLDAREAGRAPMETFYDGYVVNAIIDACYKSMKSGRWEPVGLDVWRGKKEAPGKVRGRKADEKKALSEEKESRRAVNKRKLGAGAQRGTLKAAGRAQEEKNGPGKGQTKGSGRDAALIKLKTEKLPDGRTKVIFKEKATGRVVERTS